MTGVTLEKISDKYMFLSKEWGVVVLVILIKDIVKHQKISIFSILTWSQYFPINSFKWVKNIVKIEKKLMRIKTNSSTGYVLEADIEYPQELHDIHNDYPLVPEKINIPKEWLPKYCLKIASVYNITTGTVRKLLPNLMNKNNYVIHIETCNNV